MNTKASAFLSAPLLALVLVLPGAAHAALLSQQLDFGMTNSDVSSLQTFLATDSSIYPEGLVTGYFGSMTRAAVSRYQRANGIASVGRVGPQTLEYINSRMGGGVVNNPTGDVYAPSIYLETMSLGRTSTTFGWATSESSVSRVMFATTWPFLYATVPSVSTNTYTTTPSVTLTNLQPNTRYYYVLESVDAAGNETVTLPRSFVTNQ